MLIIQCAVIVILSIAVIMWLIYFPYPSPLIRWFLKPRLRWPEAQIRGWLSSRQINKRYLRFFNRDPDRNLPAQPGLVAPADGLILSFDVHDGIRYLVIALSFWDVHVQRCPIDGRVVSVNRQGDVYTDGEGRDFAFLRQKHCPVQSRVTFDTESFGVLAVRLITSLAARRIEVWVNTGDTVKRGQRLGRILLGSTVVLELEERFPLCVNRGQRVVAGETLVAPHD